MPGEPSSYQEQPRKTRGPEGLEQRSRSQRVSHVSKDWNETGALLRFGAEQGACPSWLLLLWLGIGGWGRPKTKAERPVGYPTVPVTGEMGVMAGPWTHGEVRPMGLTEKLDMGQKSRVKVALRFFCHLEDWCCCHLRQGWLA
jgi:hypothetical protein